MSIWIDRSIGTWRTAARHRSEHARLAELPDRLLRDIGLTRDGLPMLVRQLRSKSRR